MCIFFYFFTSINRLFCYCNKSPYSRILTIFNIYSHFRAFNAAIVFAQCVTFAIPRVFITSHFNAPIFRNAHTTPCEKIKPQFATLQVPPLSRTALAMTVARYLFEYDISLIPICPVFTELSNGLSVISPPPYIPSNIPEFHHKPPPY